MGTLLSESTLLVSVRRSNTILNTYKKSIKYVQMNTLLSCFFFLNEVRQNTRKIIDMTVVIPDKIPKPDANPIMGPEGHKQR